MEPGLAAHKSSSCRTTVSSPLQLESRECGREMMDAGEQTDDSIEVWKFYRSLKKLRF